MTLKNFPENRGKKSRKLRRGSGENIRKLEDQHVIDGSSTKREQRYGAVGADRQMN